MRAGERTSRIVWVAWITLVTFQGHVLVRFRSTDGIPQVLHSGLHSFYPCIALSLCFILPWICLGLGGPSPFLSVFCSLCMLHEVRTVRGSAVEVLVDRLWSFLLSPPVSHLFVCSFIFSPIVMVLWEATSGATRGRILMGGGKVLMLVGYNVGRYAFNFSHQFCLLIM